MMDKNTSKHNVYCGSIWEQFFTNTNKQKEPISADKTPNESADELKWIEHKDTDIFETTIKSNIHDETDAEDFDILDLSEMADVFLPKVIDDEYKKKYYFVKDESLLFDIQNYTNLMTELKTNPQGLVDATELEKYRCFNEGTLYEKGIFYSEGIKTLSVYESLVGTSCILFQSFFEKYQLPIKLPNGDVFGFMGYQPNVKVNKYSFPQPIDTVSWLKQANVIGNADSLELYDGNEIYITEGLFDAYRINERFKKKSLAVLGVKESLPKLFILKELRSRGHKIISVPDADSTGKKSWLSNLQRYGNIIDSIYDFNKVDQIIEHGEVLKFKDIDAKYKYVYLKEHNISPEEHDRQYPIYDIEY